MITDPNSSTRARDAPGAATVRTRHGLLIVAVSVAVCLLILELIARAILAAPLPWRYPQVSYRADPMLIFSLVPNQHAFTADQPVTINARGLRGPIVPYPRGAAKTTRILFLGDSIVFGHGVTDEQTVSSRVAWRMAQLGMPTEVINSGVPSYNTDQEVTFAEREGVRYSPDWVVVGFCRNDISDKRGVRVSANGSLISSGAKEEDHWLDLLWEGAWGYGIRNFMKRSRVLYGAMQGINAFRAGMSPDSSSLLRQDVLHGRDTAQIASGWRNVGDSLRRLKELASTHRFRVLVVAFPIPLAHQTDFPHSSYPRKLHELAAREGLLLLDLADSYRAAYHGHESLFIAYDADHPNANGHDIAAQAIDQVLVSQAR